MASLSDLRATLVPYAATRGTVTPRLLAMPTRLQYALTRREGGDLSPSLFTDASRPRPATGARSTGGSRVIRSRRMARKPPRTPRLCLRIAAILE